MLTHKLKCFSEVWYQETFPKWGKFQLGFFFFSLTAVFKADSLTQNTNKTLFLWTYFYAPVR